MNAFDAAMEAARLRLRPILMTSLAFIFGVFPLAISTGARAGGQNAIGRATRDANVRYYEAARIGAIASYESTLQTAFREVADALATRGTIDEQIDARRARLNFADIAANLSDARYRAGVDSFLTTLDSQRTAYAARQDLVTTQL